MPTALVLDGAQRSALAITRSLGRHGVDVLVAESTPSYLCAHSRYAAKALVSPSAASNVETFVDWVAYTVEEYSVDVVFPATDISTNTLVLYPDAVGNTTIPLAPGTVYDRLTDKHSLLEIADELGIPSPLSTLILPGDPLPSIGAEDYPIVLKPTRSKFLDGDHWVSTSVRIAFTPSELAKIIDQTPWFNTHPWMLQRFIGGVGQGIFALYNRGKAVCFFSHRRLREKPPWGGVSVLCESVEPDPQMVELSRRLLDYVGWHGVAMVEFKVAADGTPYLMEVNTRFWGSLQLAIDSGVDFPWLLWQIAIGASVEPPVDFDTRQRLRWFLGDLDSLYIVLKDDRYSATEKLRRIRDFLTPDLLHTRHELFRWYDPKPAFYEASHYLRSVAGQR